MAKSINLLLQKAIFQARYKAKLTFFDLFMKAAQELKEFPHWQTDKLKITLRDFVKHCSLNIELKSFSYEQDSGDQAQEKDYIARATSVLPSYLEISAFTRMGYRRTYLLPMKMDFDSLVAMLSVKLLVQDEELKNATQRRITDLMYRIDTEDDNFKCHLTIGPVKKNEIPRWIPYNQEHHLDPSTGQQDYFAIIENYPDVAILMDIDIYKEAEDIPAAELKTFIESARNSITKMAERLSKYILIAPEV